MTTERVICMCFGYVPIFIGGGEGLRVEQRGPVRGGKKPSLKVFLRSQKKWKIALRVVIVVSKSKIETVDRRKSQWYR